MKSYGIENEDRNEKIEVDMEMDLKEPPKTNHSYTNNHIKKKEKMFPEEDKKYLSQVPIL